MSYVLYGIKACDTMKKARTWLDEHKVDYAFHDYKSAGIDRASLEKVVQRARLGNHPEPRRHDFPQAR